MPYIIRLDFDGENLVGKESINHKKEFKEQNKDFNKKFL